MAAAIDGGETSGGEDLALAGSGTTGAPGRGTPGAGATGLSEANGSNARRRLRPTNVQEVVDELAQETKRTTLLERVEQQLKGQPHVSRLLFGFGMTDDKKIQATLEQGFLEWKEQQEKQASATVTGILLFMGQCAMTFLEGPTESLFGALELFHGFAAEQKPGPDTPVGAGNRPALIHPVRVLHFTELHGVRCSASWCACTVGGKSHGTAGVVDESNSSDLVFAVYSKLMLLCLKVRDSVGGDEEDIDKLQRGYRKNSDMMPTVDEVNVLLSKSGADYYFSYAEFEKIFIAPFHLVLHSELLWPMPPALSY